MNIRFKVTANSSDLLIADKKCCMSIGLLLVKSFPHTNILKNIQEMTYEGVKV